MRGLGADVRAHLAVHADASRFERAARRPCRVRLSRATGSASSCCTTRRWPVPISRSARPTARFGARRSRSAISPHQPAMDIESLAWTHDGVATRVAFAGEVFEMEDQRNWTDASYKTYSTPLSRPFPVVIPEGGVIEQSIVFEAGARRAPVDRCIDGCRDGAVGARVARARRAHGTGPARARGDARRLHRARRRLVAPSAARRRRRAPRGARHPHRLVARRARSRRASRPATCRSTCASPLMIPPRSRSRSRQPPRPGPSCGSPCSTAAPRDRAGALAGAGGCRGPPAARRRAHRRRPLALHRAQPTASRPARTTCPPSRSPSRRRCTRPSGRSSSSRSRSSSRSCATRPASSAVGRCTSAR